MEVITVIARDKKQINSDQGTNGFLLSKENNYPIFYCKTLELPWRDNLPNISCLPLGEDYELIWCWSDHFKKFMYLIKENIKERSGFRIHSGVWAGDKEKGFKTHSAGCPLVGDSFGLYQGQKAIFNSRNTLKQWEYIMKGRKSKLIIREI